MLLANRIRSMGQGGHVWLIFDTFAEQVASVAPFIRTWIERG